MKKRAWALTLSMVAPFTPLLYAQAQDSLGATAIEPQESVTTRSSQTQQTPLETAGNPESEVATSDTPIDLSKLSYSLGVQLGQLLAKDLETLDVAAFTQGLQDLFEGSELRYSEEAMQQVVQTYRQQRMLTQQQKHEQLAAANQETGRRFLAENAQRAGVITLESGLQYRVLRAGEGAIPALTDRVEVHYRAQRLDGQVIDSTYSQAQPVSFRVEDAIPGWQQALQRMPVGAKWQLFIPADLAYGPGGTDDIGPNEALLFEVELLAIQSEPQSGLEVSQQ